jgi:hypothetical protein
MAGRAREVAEASEMLQSFFRKRGVAMGKIEIREHVTRSKDIRFSVDSASSVVSPLVQQWSERAYILPTLSLEKFISTPHGLRSWTISLLENHKLLKAWSSEDGPEPIVFPPLALEPHNLTALISVIDSVGEHFSSDSLVLDIPDLESDGGTPATRTVYVLLSKPTGPKLWHDLLLKNAQDQLIESSKVQVERLTSNVEVSAALKELLPSPVALPPKVEVLGDEREEPALFDAYELTLFR